MPARVPSAQLSASAPCCPPQMTLPVASHRSNRPGRPVPANSRVPFAIVGSPASQILLQLFALVNRSGADADRTATDLRNSPDRTLAFPRAQQPANGIPKILVAKRRVFETADSAH